MSVRLIECVKGLFKGHCLITPVPLMANTMAANNAELNMDTTNERPRSPTISTRPGQKNYSDLDVIAQSSKVFTTANGDQIKLSIQDFLPNFKEIIEKMLVDYAQEAVCSVVGRLGDGHRQAATVTDKPKSTQEGIPPPPHPQS